MDRLACHPRGDAPVPLAVFRLFPGRLFLIGRSTHNPVCRERAARHVSPSANLPGRHSALGTSNHSILCFIILYHSCHRKSIVLIVCTVILSIVSAAAGESAAAMLHLPLCLVPALFDPKDPPKQRQQRARGFDNNDLHTPLSFRHLFGISICGNGWCVLGYIEILFC